MHDNTSQSQSVPPSQAAAPERRYHSQASAQLALEGSGRFGALAQQERAAKPTLAGTEPFVRYPGGASWTRDANMLEPPLGYSVDDMQPIGEALEVARVWPRQPFSWSGAWPWAERRGSSGLTKAPGC